MDRVVAFLVLLLSLSRLTFLFPKVPDPVYYGSFLVSFGGLLLRGKNLSVTGLYLPFLIAILLSIGVNDIPSFFQVHFRLVAFLALVFLCGPFLRNDLLDAFRKKLFIYTLWTIEWITVFSFVGYLFRLPVVTTGVDFRGFTTYSMTLGPVSAASIIYCLYLFYTSERKIEKWIGLSNLFLSLFVCIIAGSRGALGAGLLGVLFFIGNMYRFRFVRLLYIASIGVVLLAVTNRIWWPMTERMREKMELSEKHENVLFSRDALWADRLNEFRAFPIFGVGFASYNMQIAKNNVSKTTGTIEPGSSWLFLLSSMGLAGLVTFSFPILKMLYRSVASSEGKPERSLLGALLILFIGHMLFEGYVVASGAYLCFFLWLLLSECNRRLIKD